MFWSILVTLTFGTSEGLPVAHAPDVTVSEGALRFYLSHATFQVTDTIRSVDVFFLLDVSSLQTEMRGETLVGDYSVEVTLISPKGDTLRDQWRKRPRLLGRGTNRFILDKFDLYLLPGTYTLTLRLKDHLSGQEGVAQRTIEAPPPDTSLHLSDIELAVDISGKASREDVFYKRGLRVVPNAVGSYQSKRSDTLLFYFEIYNLKDDSGRYVFSYEIADTSGKSLIVSRPVARVKQGSAAVEIGGLALHRLSSGPYRLNVEVVDLSTGERTRGSRSFYYVSERPMPASVQDPFEGHEEIAAFIDYLASEEELKEFRSIQDPEARRLWLIRFWSRRDPDPSTPQNELFEEFVRRVQYADEHFSTQIEKGRYTDRGRIYIKYGPPDEVKRSTLVLESQDREYWFYSTRGGIEFIFVDINGPGDFQLVYSSIPEEPTMPGWQRYVPPEELGRPGTGW